jgi:predicted nucleotidyltransferase
VISDIQLKRLRENLREWTQDAIEERGAAAVYLFGSLVYRNGEQFGDSSDIDLVVLMPSLDTALARHRWLESFSEHKGRLETTLLRTLTRLGDEPIASLVAITEAEVAFDIHKDGHREFFTKNVFRDLATNEDITGLPGAGKQVPTRFLAAALAFTQKVRNEHFAISANGTPTLMAHGGSDPLPKRIMRAAAMSARATNTLLAAGAEYDVQEGLDLLTQYLYQVRDTSPQYNRLQNLLSVRRNARGASGPIEPSDQLLLGELIYDLTLGAIGGQNNDPSISTNIKEMVHITGFKKEITTAPPREELSDTGLANAAALAIKGESERQSIPQGSSTVLFHERFAGAFPGVRGTSWFEDEKQIAMRLEALLKAPLVFAEGTPIWWWRGGNLQIERFVRLETGIFLLNYEELAIRRIGAVPGRTYARDFVYVETNAMEPTGLYERSPEDIRRSIQSTGYDYEEYGLYSGRHLLTRGEYDDGAAVIDGSLVETAGNSVLRIRYITPYNFIIAPIGSPVNNATFDDRLEQLLNEALHGNREEAIARLREEIHKLPLRTGRAS